MARGLSLDDILKKSWATDLATSRYVAVTGYSKLTTRNAVKIQTITRQPREGVRKHKVIVYAADKNYTGPIYKCPAIKLSCDCQRWMFTFEVAMAQKGAADVIYSNGMLPIEKNPSMKIGCCKHLIKALMFIKQKKL